MNSTDPIDPSAAPADSGQIGLFPDDRAEVAAREAEHARQSWTQDAETVLVGLIAAGDPFDAHAITQLVQRDPPERGMMTRLLRTASRQGRIRRVGYQPTRRPTSGSVAAIWQATDSGLTQAQARLHGRSRPLPTPDPPPAASEPEPEPAKAAPPPPTPAPAPAPAPAPQTPTRTGPFVRPKFRRPVRS